MGIISRKFAKAYCKDEDERKADDKQRREDLASRMKEFAEKRREEKEKMRLLPLQTQRNLKCAKIMLGVFAPVSAAGVIYSAGWGSLCSVAMALAVTGTLLFSKWRRMALMPCLGTAAGMIIGFTARLIWRG